MPWAYPSGVSLSRRRSSSIDSNTRSRPPRAARSSEKPPVSTAIVSTPAFAGRAAVPGRVADHHRRAAADALQRGLHEVGRGLGLLDVADARPRVGEPARVEQVEVVLDLVGLGRAGAGPRGAPRRLRSTISSRAPCSGSTSSIIAMYRAFSAARMSSPCALLDLVAAQRGDELVAAHADVAVDAPDRRRAGRAGAARGTRRSCAGSWSRRACRRCRGSPRAAHLCHRRHEADPEPQPDEQRASRTRPRRSRVGA